MDCYKQFCIFAKYVCLRYDKINEKKKSFSSYCKRSFTLWYRWIIVDVLLNDVGIDFEKLNPEN